jgi:hypothetical protein
MFKKDNIKSQCEDCMNNQVPLWLGTPNTYTFEEFLAWYLYHLKTEYNPDKDLLWEHGKSIQH